MNIVKIDWSKIIVDLQASGMTQSEIAEKAECSQGHISDLLNGRRGKAVSYAVGCRLLALHRKAAKAA